MKLKDSRFVCEISASNLVKLISDGSAAASRTANFPRYVDTCCLKFNENYLVAVSIDCKRLAVAKTLCEKIDSREEMVFSASELKELGKTLANHTDENVKIITDDSTTYFYVDGVEFSRKRLDVSFPKYERVLNNEIHTRMRADTSDLISALERVEIIIPTKLEHIMVLTLNPENNEGLITAHSQDYGFIHETFHAEIERNYLQIGFKAKYFLDTLKVVKTGTSVIEFSGAEKQARIKRENDDNFLYLLMPARLVPSDLVNENDNCEGL